MAIPRDKDGNPLRGIVSEGEYRQFVERGIVTADEMRAEMAKDWPICECGHLIGEHDDPDHSGFLFCRVQDCSCRDFRERL